jgi:hypothetical protein
VANDQNEEVKCLLCVLSGFCNPDVMDILFSFGVMCLGNLLRMFAVL